MSPRRVDREPTPRRPLADGTLVATPAQRSGRMAMTSDILGANAREAMIDVVRKKDPTAVDRYFYDLVRVENGRIAEHWDVLTPRPPRDQWKNANGPF